MRKILKKVKKGRLSPEEAYELIYGIKSRKANYAYMRIKIKDHKFVSGFVNLLFFFPLPLGLIKPIVYKVLNENGIDPSFYKIIRECGGGSQIKVKSSEAIVNIRLI